MPAAANKTEDKVARIPLVGSFFNRIEGSAVVSTTGTVGLGVVGLMLVGGPAGTAATVTKDQRFVNCIPEKITNPFTNQPKFFLRKRPGFEVYNSGTALKASHIGNACHVWASKGTGAIPIFAIGNTNSEIFEATTSLGSITGKCTGITETILGTTPNLLFTSGDNTAWYYPSGGALTQITDVDFPGNASRTITGKFVGLDGYTFVMDTTGRIYNSDLNSIANWTATSFLTAQMYPDAGVGLARYKNQIVAFGKETIEFFRNAGNADASPLVPTSQAFTRLGCAGAQTITVLEDTVAWISSSDRNGIGLYMLDGYVPKRISTATIDAQFQKASLSDLSTFSFRLVGKTFIGVVTLGTTFVYCVEDDSWHEWTSPDGPLWTYVAGTTGSNSILYSLSGQVTAGKAYFINSQSLQYQDASANFTFLVQTSKVDFDTIKNKFGAKLSIVGDIAGAACTVNIQWSDDDYNTFSTARTIDLANNNPNLTAIGSFRRRAFKFTNSDSNFIRLEAMELQFREGTH